MWRREAGAATAGREKLSKVHSGEGSETSAIGREGVEGEERTDSKWRRLW